MDDQIRRYGGLRQLNWRWVLSGFVVILVCLFFYRQLDYVANGEHRPALLTFWEEAVGSIAGMAVFPLIYSSAVKFPLLSPAWRRNLLIQLAAVCLISVVHTTLIAGLRALFFPLLGLHESYGYLPWRYPMEFAHLFIFYWLGVGLIYLFHEIHFAREREIRQAKLEASLSEAQLQNLRLQLEPHFLFNALNAISAALYENPRVADEMIGRLSELLRQLLKNDRSQEVSLSREIELLKLYTRIMEARLEHRLNLAIDVDEAVRESLVPQLILQPLVENAIRYGMDPRTFGIDVKIAARRENGRVLIVVRDHGPGIPVSQTPRNGVGLRNTAERLQRLYGEQQTLDIRNAVDGGALVELYLPYHVASGLEPNSPVDRRSAEQVLG